MTPDVHPGTGKKFQFIYLNDNGRADAMTGTATEVYATTVNIRTDSGEVVVLDRSRIIDDLEVPATAEGGAS